MNRLPCGRPADHASRPQERGRKLTATHRLSLIRSCTVLLLFLAAAGCATCPRPGFVGVPEEVERTPDLVLPLGEESRDILIGFLARGGRPPRGWTPDDEDPGLIGKARGEYGQLLSVLGEKAPADEDLRAETGSVARLFDDPSWVLAVHDARVGRDETGAFYDLDSGRARAFVRAEFVFAFYRRPLRQIIVPQPAGAGQGQEKTATLWVLDPETPGRYTGLVVFHRAFASPVRAE